MRKILSGVAALIVLLLITLASVLLTHRGNVLLWQQATAYLEPLNGELAYGNLLDGWTFRNLGWDDSQISFQSGHIQLQWKLSALRERKLPVSLLAADDVAVVLKPVNSVDDVSQEDKQTTTDDFAFPVDLKVDQLAIRNFRFQSADADIQLGSLTAELRMSPAGLDIKIAQLDQLSMKLPESETQPSSGTSSQSKTAEAITLPEVSLPFPIDINQLQLNEINFQQGNIKEQLEKLTLSFNGAESTFQNIRLKVAHSKAATSLTGKIELAGSYPMMIDADIQLKAALAEGMPSNQRLQLAASGALDNLNIHLTGKGTIDTQLDGTVAVTDPQIPFDMALGWRPLSWPFTGNPQVNVGQGALSLKGSLSGYQLKLDTAVDVPGQPVAKIELSGNGNLDQFDIKRLLLKEPEGELLLSGVLGWKDGVRWQGDTTLKDLNPGLWLPELPGKLQGNIKTDFSLIDDRWQVSVSDLSLSGVLRDYPVKAEGSLTAQQANNGSIPVSVDIHQLAIAIGKNHLTANGQLADSWQLTANINAPSLDELYPGLKGEIKGDINLTGSAKEPIADFDLISPKIEFNQFKLLSLTGKGKITTEQGVSGQSRITIGELVADQLKLNNIKLDAHGNEQQHSLLLSADGQPVSGRVLLKGSLQEQTWAGQLAKAFFNTPLDQWVLKSPLQIKVNEQQNIALSEQCWQSLDSQLCLDEARISAAKGSAKFRLTNFSMKRLASFMPEDFSWQSVLSAEGLAQWQGDKPVVDLTLETTPGKLGVGELIFGYDQLETTLKFKQDTLNSQLNFRSPQLGVASINLKLSDLQKHRTLDGTVSLKQLQLGFLGPFIPEVSRVDGVLSADAKMAGTLEQPLLYGELALNQGQVETDAELVTIKDWVTRLLVNGNQGEIQGSMQVGGGEIKLGGNLDWQQLPPTGLLTVKGENLEAQYPGLLEIRVSPDLKMVLGEQVNLTGEINIPWARIVVKALPKNAVKISDDVVIVTPEKEQETEPVGSANFMMKVSVVLGDDITLDAYGLQTNLAGELLVLLEPEKSLAGNGSILLKNGRYRYLGQDLLIEEGKIIIAGPLSSPYLVVDAIRNPDAVVDDTRVGIKVSGTVKNPTWEVYSTPAMSQQEQLSYLLQGKGLDNADDSPVQALLVDVGVSQFGGVASQIGEAVGFSDVRLGTEGAGDDTKVTIGGNITPGLRLQYGAGVFDSVSEIKARYEVMPRLYLQAISGAAQAVDLLYQFKIKSSK